MYFELDVHENLESGKCLPLYIHDEGNRLRLVGGFLAKRGDRVGFFVSKESWIGLMIDGGNKFYFRAIRDQQSVVVGGILEEARTAYESVEIKLDGGEDGSDEAQQGY